MDPTKNPVDPNRLRKTSAPSMLAGSEKRKVSAQPAVRMISEPGPGPSSSASAQDEILPAAHSPPRRDLRRTMDDHNRPDPGEALLDDMVQEYTSPLRAASAPVVDTVPQKFDHHAFVNSAEAQPEARHYDERDFQSHRRESFGQTHQPLRPIHSHSSNRSSLRRKISVPRMMGTSSSVSSLPPDYSDNNTLMLSQSEGQLHHDRGQGHGQGHGHGHGGPSGQIDAIEEEEMPESWPLLQDPDPSSSTMSFAGTPGENATETTSTVSGYEDFMDSPLKRVQFEVGGSPYHSASEDLLEPNVEKKKHKIRTHKYEDPQWRLRQGSDLPLILRELDSTGRPELGLVDMPEHDKDDLSSHRFGDTKGFRRHKFYPREQDESHGHGGAAGLNRLGEKSSKYDHQPHEIFVELDMLSGSGEDREWQETARWIKYEEDLEEGADRWGKPHVASLSFHSLINLRRLLEGGVVLMDLEERDLPGVAYRVVEQMGMSDLIRTEEKTTVLRSLLLKHKHVHDGGKSVWGFASKRNSGSLTSLHTTMDDRNKSRPLMSAFNLDSSVVTRRNSSAVGRLIRNDSMIGQAVGRELISSPNIRAGAGPVQNGQSQPPHYPLREFRSSPAHIALEIGAGRGSSAAISDDDIRWLSNKEDILRRIPSGAEASIVLVGKDDTLQSPTLAFARLAESVYMPNITEVPIPVRFVFILMGPSSSDLDYKEVGRSISTLMSNMQFHSIAYRADTRKDLLKGIHDFLDESIVLPPGDWDDQLFPFDELKEKSKEIRLRKQLRRRSTLLKAGKGVDIPDERRPSRDETPPKYDPFKRTRKAFGGLKNDVKRRYSLYCSDIRDGCNVQCLATIIFLYFACVAGAIAFGGLMAQKTNNYIGITETLIGTCVGGILFAFTSAQPLLILGTTGPLLVFDESLFRFCQSFTMSGEEFLAVRTWIGLWMVIIGILVAAFEGAVIVRYFTRFTIEIFATYISLVFIAESLKSLVQIYIDHPLMANYGNCLDGDFDVREDQHRPNVALLATMLMLGTFTIAYFFRGFRNSGYLTKPLRNMLGNFAVLIAIVCMSLVDLLIHDTDTDKLDIPDAMKVGLKNSVDGRGWVINPLNLELTWIGISFLPALLLYILVFMETSITGLLIGKKEMKLRKGSGYHLDIVLICLINAIMGFLGTCWISSAIVRGVAHTVALTVYSTNNPPGEKPSIVGVKEQRVTALAVSVLMGLSVLMADILKLIPMSVVFGVFLFMGVCSMSGIQFLQRVKLLFKQVQNHPQVPFVRRVRMWKMHIFTFIQLGALVLLWGVKESPAALALPVIIILLVPFRLKIMNHWFSSQELAALDAHGLEVKEPAEKPVSVATLPSPEKLHRNSRNGGVYQVVEENGKNPSMNGTILDFRSI